MFLERRCAYFILGSYKATSFLGNRLGYGNVPLMLVLGTYTPIHSLYFFVTSRVYQAKTTVFNCLKMFGENF